MADQEESKITVHIKSTKQKIDIDILSSESVGKVWARLLYVLKPFKSFETTCVYVCNHLLCDLVKGNA